MHLHLLKDHWNPDDFFLLFFNCVSTLNPLVTPRNYIWLPDNSFNFHAHKTLYDDYPSCWIQYCSGSILAKIFALKATNATSRLRAHEPMSFITSYNWNFPLTVKLWQHNLFLFLGKLFTGIFRGSLIVK